MTFAAAAKVGHGAGLDRWGSEAPLSLLKEPKPRVTLAAAAKVWMHAWLLIAHSGGPRGCLGIRGYLGPLRPPQTVSGSTLALDLFGLLEDCRQSLDEACIALQGCDEVPDELLVPFVCRSRRRLDYITRQRRRV